MIEFIKKENKSNVILFVHGFVGGRETWMNENEPSDFLKYLLKQDEINSNYDLALFNYFTKISDLFEDVSWFFNLIKRKRKIKRNLSIDEISNLLSSQIDIVLKNYEKIVLISHSMGGLVSKSYIIKSIKEDQISRVKLYISLSVPHNGSDLASLGKAIVNNPQVKDLAPLGDSINEINKIWVKQDNAVRLPRTLYHQGSYDKIVPKVSSIGYDSRDVEVIYSDNDHFSILKPENNSDVVILSCINELTQLLQEDTDGASNGKESTSGDQMTYKEGDKSAESKSKTSNISGKNIISGSQINLSGGGDLRVGDS